HAPRHRARRDRDAPRGREVAPEEDGPVARDRPQDALPEDPRVRYRDRCGGNAGAAGGRGMSRSRAVAALAVVLALAGCGPRNKLGDRLLGQDSLTDGRSSITNSAPAKSP